MQHGGRIFRRQTFSDQRRGTVGGGADIERIRYFAVGGGVVPINSFSIKLDYDDKATYLYYNENKYVRYSGSYSWDVNTYDNKAILNKIGWTHQMIIFTTYFYSCNIIRPSYVTQRFSDILAKNKMRHIRFHDLRHTCASLLINKGVPLINVSNTLGHSTISTTANIYGHLDMSSKRSTANIMNELFGQSKSKNE